MQLQLAICEKTKIIDVGVLATSFDCVKTLAPKKDPSFVCGDASFWNIDFERRRAFAEHINKTMEGFNKKRFNNFNAEEVLCFFSLVGLGTKWADEKDVEWILAKANGMKKGDTINADERIFAAAHVE